MTNAEAIGILAIVVETAKGRCFVTDEAISDAYGMAISALETQERTESLYQMACERIDKKREVSPYELGRLSALADATGHVAQAFSSG